jgi:hypothetical protein
MSISASSVFDIAVPRILTIRGSGDRYREPVAAANSSILRNMHAMSNSYGFVSAGFS